MLMTNLYLRGAVHTKFKKIIINCLIEQNRVPLTADLSKSEYFYLFAEAKTQFDRVLTILIFFRCFAAMNLSTSVKAADMKNRRYTEIDLVFPANFVFQIRCRRCSRHHVWNQFVWELLSVLINVSPKCTWWWCFKWFVCFSFDNSPRSTYTQLK